MSEVLFVILWQSCSQPYFLFCKLVVYRFFFMQRANLLQANNGIIFLLFVFKISHTLSCLGISISFKVEVDLNFRISGF